MSPILISIFAFVAVTALVSAAIVIYIEHSPNKSEARLRVLAGLDAPAPETAPGVLKQEPFSLRFGKLSQYLAGVLRGSLDPNLLFQQANSPISAETFLGISAGCATLGLVVAVLTKAPLPLYPVLVIACGLLPLGWLLMRRRARFRKFTKQLPDCLQLLGSALRSGNSLAAGIRFIAKEMRPPISSEFAMVYEASNMGVPIEQALQDMLKRMPDQDLKFVVALVVLQRETGGNLAEMLDKISYVVVERFKILGQVKALTGEGRISGIVLMALPVVLFFTLYHLNPAYVMVLFEEEIGRKVLLVAGVLQILGAYTIKKIVDIKV